MIFDNPDTLTLELSANTVCIRALQGNRSVSARLLIGEVRFVLQDEPLFNPWFDDLSQLIRIAHDGIQIVPSYYAEGTEKSFIPFRVKEMKACLAELLADPTHRTVSILGEFEIAQVVAVPLVEEQITEKHIFGSRSIRN